MPGTRMEKQIEDSIKHSTNNCYTTIGVNAELTLLDAKWVGYQTLPVQLSYESSAAMECSYSFLKSCIDQRLPIYGINTQFGDQVSFIDVNLKNENTQQYYDSINSRQTNIIKSLACGLGQVISPEIIRVTMMLRAHCLAQGFSGVSSAAVHSILTYLNSGITPIVRYYGSIGASGDLIPLSMIAAAIIGEEVDVLYQGQVMKATAAMQLAGIQKFSPELRDGLAMINGTSFMTAIASLSLYDLRRLFKQMLAAVAMALESLLVISSAYQPLVHQLKRQVGQAAINQFMLNFWQGSQLLTDLDELRGAHDAVEVSENIKPVQDCYSIRSVPQGFGPFQENLERAITWIENEMNSVNDNPIIDAPARKIHHGANFMGYYVTDSCDILKMDIAQASTWIHAVLANMVHPRKNHHLPSNLVENPGKNNGFRSMQLLAAALTVQNRKLSAGHQAFALPTEGDNQDVNSLGTHAALDFRESVTNLERLTAILFLASAQALELRGINKASVKAQEIYQTIRGISPTVLECRPMSEEINCVVKALQEEKI